MGLFDGSVDRYDSGDSVEEFPPEEAVESDEQPAGVDEQRVDEERAATPSRSSVKRSSRGRSRKTKAAATAAPAPVPRADLPSAQASRAIQSIFGGMIVAGPAPSGATYAWSEAGSVVQVAADDVDWVMAKNGNRADQCCGSSGPPVYFRLAD